MAGEQSSGAGQVTSALGFVDTTASSLAARALARSFWTVRSCARFACIKARVSLTLIVPLVLAALVLVAAGCGGSSKPDYCSDVSDLQSSVDDLKSVQLESGALTTLKTDFQKVQSNANAVVSSAKQDFPNETSALQSSVSTLSASIDALPAAPTAQQLLPIASQVSSVVTAAQGLESATSSACD